MKGTYRIGVVTDRSGLVCDEANVIETTEQTVSETIESIKAHLKSGQNRIG